MSKAEDIAAGISLIGALKNLGGTGPTTPPTTPPTAPPAPPQGGAPVEVDEGPAGPDTWTRGDIDAVIGCLDSLADSAEVVADAVKLMIEHATASHASPAPPPATNHQRKQR